MPCIRYCILFLGLKISRIGQKPDRRCILILRCQIHGRLSLFLHRVQVANTSYLDIPHPSVSLTEIYIIVSKEFLGNLHARDDSFKASLLGKNFTGDSDIQVVPYLALL